MGSGKSTVGRALSDRLGRPFLDLDEMIVAETGRTIPELFREDGERAFRAAEAAALPRALATAAIVALGGGTPLDDESWRLLKRDAITIWLDAPLAVLRSRLADDLHGDPAPRRPLLPGRSEQELERLYAARAARYRECDVRIDASRPLEIVVEAALRACGG